jgi:hypothetical protein
MLHYLFRIDKEEFFSENVPQNEINYVDMKKKLYFILKISKLKIELYGDNENLLGSGTFHDDFNPYETIKELKYSIAPSDVLLLLNKGGTIIINGNDCLLHSNINNKKYKGTLTKLIAKNPSA